jgi:hypothetical protein
MTELSRYILWSIEMSYADKSGARSASTRNRTPRRGDRDGLDCCMGHGAVWRRTLHIAVSTRSPAQAASRDVRPTTIGLQSQKHMKLSGANSILLIPLMHTTSSSFIRLHRCSQDANPKRSA